jgi:hypothetical protein
MRDGRMHQTTVRFGPDLWEALEAECARLGVSAAQYLREAALARLSYSAGRRRELDYQQALERAGAAPAAKERRPARATPDAVEQSSDAAAVRAQSQLARTRARAIREESQRLRGQRWDVPWQPLAE